MTDNASHHTAPETADDPANAIWSGWRFTVVGDEPDDPDKRSLYHYRRKRYQLQTEVIETIRQYAPSLVTGTADATVTDNHIQAILKAIEIRPDVQTTTFTTTDNVDAHNQDPAATKNVKAKPKAKKTASNTGAMTKKTMRPGYALKHCRNFLVQGLDRGVREGLWDINVPAPVMTVRRDKALFQPETFRALPALRAVQCLLAQSLSDATCFENTNDNLYRQRLCACYPQLSDEQAFKQLRAGQLLLSALIYGGLLDRHCWYQLPQQAHVLQANANGCWIDFYHTVNLAWEDGMPRAANQKGKRITRMSTLRRRWWPDAITELLLMRWQQQALGTFPSVTNKTAGNQAERHCQFLIHAFLRAAGATALPTVSDLLTAASTATALDLPAFLVHVATGKLASTPLPLSAMYRLSSDCRSQAAPLCHDDHQPAALAQMDEWRVFSSEALKRHDNLKLFNTLRTQLAVKEGKNRPSHSSRITILETFMAEHQQQLAPPLLRLCQWGLVLYRNGSVNKKRLNVSTVPKYLSQVKDLITVLGTADPLSLDTEELLDTYQTLIDGCKTLKAKAYKGGRIREFHAFLESQGYCAGIQFSELNGVTGAASGVDANYLNETAYQAAYLELARFDADHATLITARQLALMLGYRCGLRRNEVHKLQLRDIQNGDYPVLLMRANSYRSLKSTQSTRQLPLKTLLTDSELRQLVDWCDCRRTSQGLDRFRSDDSFIFIDVRDGMTLLNDALIFPVIHQVLRAVTGDASVRFHHLRHSFANNLLLRLMGVSWTALVGNGAEKGNQRLMQCNTVMPTTNPTPSIPKGTDPVPIADRLFGLDVEALPSRSHLYQVAIMLGHADPAITLKSYIHVCDQLLHYYLNNAHHSALSDKTLVAVGGIKRDALIKFRQRNHPGQSLLAIALLRIRNETIHRSFVGPHPLAIPQRQSIVWPAAQLTTFTTQAPQAPSLNQLYQLIIQTQQGALDQAHYDQWANRLGFLPERVKQWLDASAEMAAQKTEKGVRCHIRPLHFGIKDVNKKAAIKTAEQQQPPRCMRWPHQQNDRADMEHVFEALQSLGGSDCQLARWGVAYFVQHNRATKSYLWMTTAADATKFISFTRALGIPVSRIRGQLKINSQGESQQDQVTAWCNQLSTKTDIIAPNQLTVCGTIDNTQRPNGSLRLAVTHQNNKASYGFRFALYMTGVLMLAAGVISF